MTAGRTVLVAVVATVGFVVGFYGGLVVLLSVVGLDGFRGWHFPLATVPTGSVVAGLLAGAVAPRRPWLPVLTSSVAAGLVATGIVYVVDGDFAVSILLGTAVVAAAATTAAARQPG